MRRFSSLSVRNGSRLGVLGLRLAREPREDTMTWRKRPVIYEIATLVWLEELRSRYGQALTLATIPAQEWDALAGLCVDAVWLMGVGERSPAGVVVANGDPDLQAEFRRVLPAARRQCRLRLLRAELRRRCSSRGTGCIGAGARRAQCAGPAPRA